MEWTSDVSMGDWLREGIDDPWRVSIHDVVPRGFAAYARVLHPATRDRPIGVPWPAEGDKAGWARFADAAPEIETEQVTWAQTANAFGTRMHPLAQWHRITGRSRHANGDGPRDRDGWMYREPDQGQLDVEAWRGLAAVLASRTTTADDGGVAIWEGWGGLLGGMGDGGSATFGWDAAGNPLHQTFLSHATRDVLNKGYNKPRWRPGILSDEISRGPRLELPGRAFVLFRGGVNEFTGPDWRERMPWADPQSVATGFPWFIESPSVVWPADHAWIVVSEVDFDCTIVGGSAALVDELLRTPGLEVQALPADADLSWDGDTVNAPAGL